jgi:hypothetical protein
MKFWIVLLSLIAAPAVAAENWVQFLGKASQELQIKQAKVEKQYELSKQERYEVDKASGKLVFYSGGVATASTPFQAIGSYAPQNESWVWSWANEGVDPAHTARMKAVADYGKAHEFVQLTEPIWRASEDDGWAMAGIATHLLQAEGVYRIQLENGLVIFLLLEKIQKGGP